MSYYNTLSKQREEGKLQKRLSKRMRMVVPVKVLAQDESGATTTYLAHTLDATEKGVRLGGFHGRLDLGQTVTVQYQHRRCSFRVIWLGQYGTPQGTQLGLECLDPGKDIWKIDEDETSSVFGNARRASPIMQSRWATEPGF